MGRVCAVCNNAHSLRWYHQHKKENERNDKSGVIAISE
jgi:hypothetical protein